MLVTDILDCYKLDIGKAQEILFREEAQEIGVKAILQKPLSLEHLDETMSRFRHLK
jgi:hypothetical protein